MPITFKKAVKSQAKARIGLIGPSGSGKTYTGLLLAAGLGNKIAVIDTEHGSASKYSDEFDFDVVELQTFNPRLYIEAIKAAADGGYDVLLIDSLSHAWAGTEGALELADKNAAKYGGNRFAAWRDVTPLHNKLVEAIISAPMHVIATMRTKMTYIQTQDEKGKTVIKKVGLEPIQREGMEYEFDIVAEMNLDHNLVITKTRYRALDGLIINKPDGQLAEVIKAWLSDGVPAQPSTNPTSDNPKTDNHEYRKQFFAKFSEWVKSQNLDSTAADHACSAVLCEAFQVDSRSKLTEEQWRKCLQPNWFNSLCSKVLEFLEKKENAANA